MTDGNDPMALVCDRNAYENGEATMARFVEINANWRCDQPRLGRGVQVLVAVEIMDQARHQLC
ncbi:MAG: hypothetical protein IPP80_00405 [Ignavibacteria bacterium]|nr:hypothetical protein [Ignavibacteria bacterium]